MKNMILGVLALVLLSGCNVYDNRIVFELHQIITLDDNNVKYDISEDKQDIKKDIKNAK